MSRTAGQGQSKKPLVQIFVESPKNQRVIASLAKPDCFDFDIALGFLDTICKEIHGIQSWQDFYRRLSALNCPHLSEVTSNVRKMLKYMKARETQGSSLVATHRQKRKLIAECGIRQKKYSVADILSDNVPDTIPPIAIMWRERSDTNRKIRRNTYLSEYDRVGPEQATGKKIERTADYDMTYLPDNESHIVLSGSPNNFEIELIALRHVATNDGPYSNGLMNFLSQAVDAARDMRRNVGHCRIFGAAKSFTKKLTDEQMIHHDHDIIGAVSVFWAICQAILPEEVTSAVNQYIDEEQLPALQTRNVEPGDNLLQVLAEICINTICRSWFYTSHQGKAFLFPLRSTCSPEAYINKGYSAPTHTDPTYCRFALAFIVRRDIDRDHQARQGAKALHDHIGGNYVDVRLGVIVASATGTVIAFKPGEMHATTLSYGACNYGYATTFSRRLADGYRELSEEEKADYFIKLEEIVTHA
ncbi:hypothetical protein D9757_011702 [Collybiopsis confluens]|uniref:Uncharacterized protein n=1 Tax=Collybiopsis confluens TaxID=2823264 RepID=A0A8H5GM31_9AGAR|nr:hypothetical protein D9757_011702 [Collybiopsis confluens]